MKKLAPLAQRLREARETLEATAGITATPSRPPFVTFHANLDENDDFNAGRIADSLGLISATKPKPAGVSIDLCVGCDDDESSSNTTTPRKHFTCGVCLDRCWADERSSLALPCCDTQFCGPCWAGWVKAQAQAGTTKLDAIQCPQPGCPRILNPLRFLNRPTEMKAAALRLGLKSLCTDRLMLSGEQKKELEAIVALDANPSARRCPRCAIVTGTRNGASMVCENAECSLPEDPRGLKLFCPSHGDQHLGETCREFNNRTMEPGRAAFARLHHTKLCPNCGMGICKNGGCDHMRCACGHRFNWSQAQVEVPCNCLNLSRMKPGQTGPSRVIVPWGAAPCEGASKLAHAKLFAWRCGFGAAVSPIVVLGVAAALPILIPYAGYKTAKATKLTVHQALSGPRVHAEARRRGLQPGTFEYEFLVNGEGRRRFEPRVYTANTRPRRGGARRIPARR